VGLHLSADDYNTHKSPPVQHRLKCHRLDSWHAVEHLAAVGEARFGEDSATMAAWLEPLKRQVKNESAVKVIRQLEDLLGELEEAARRGKRWPGKWPICGSTRGGWTIGGRSGGKNRWAVGRWRRPARSISAGSSARGSFGVRLGTKRYCVWTPSGATSAGICSSRTPRPHNLCKN